VGEPARPDFRLSAAGKARSTIASMATTKITVTVPEELAAYIREQVEAGNFDSISAFVTKAAESMRAFEPLDLLIASMIAETGEPDERARAWVDDAMAKGPPPSTSGRRENPGQAA
jgi:Arc/MetJ-type ribon-helix-helix transcriptional regulator